MRAMLSIPLALAVASTAVSDELAEKARTAATRSQDAVFMLKCLIEFDIQGRKGEAPVEVPAMVLDPSGLLVAPNPEQLLLGQMGQMAAQATVESKGFKLVLPDGKELAAKTVGRDANTSLLFLRLNDAAGAALKPIQVRPSDLQLGDTMFLVRRFSQAHPEMICQDVRVTSVIQKPRLMYLVSNSLGPGSLALAEDGSLVGLNLILRETNAQGQPVQMAVVLPMAQISEVAKGIREGGAEPAPDLEPIPEIPE